MPICCGKVSTKADCERFVRETGFGFEALIEVLDFLFRWVLPFKILLKELSDTLPEPRPAGVVVLKKHKIRSNLDVLERFRSAAGRQAFAAETGVSETLILNLAHRADLSRPGLCAWGGPSGICAAGATTRWRSWRTPKWRR